MKKLFLALTLLAACSARESGDLSGYVEGDYIYASPVSGGILDAVFVKRGQNVAANDPLFVVGGDVSRAEIARAQSEIDRLRAKLNDLNKGKRPQELAVVARQLEQARLTAKQARTDFARAEKLLETRSIAQAAFDKARTAADTADARVKEIEADYQTALLPARADEIEMARSELAAAEQDLKILTIRSGQNSPLAPADARVEEVYHRAGETVAAGTPVLSLLPPENVKIRFYVPETRRKDFAVGTKIAVSCDSCEAPLPAAVVFTSTAAEFTPPVIYSVESRQKLLYRTEAVFENAANVPPVGTPVSIKAAAP